MELILDKNINKKYIKGKNNTYLFDQNNNINHNLENSSQKYDQKNVSLLNKLSSLISKFNCILKKSINDISNVSITLGNQTIYSKTLLLEMNKNDEKYFQLNDRIEMINDTKNLLDNN